MRVPTLRVLLHVRKIHGQAQKEWRSSSPHLPFNGLSRTNRPVDAVNSFSSSTSKKGPTDEGNRVSDDEWDLRVGRGLYVLTSTLPDFFNSGLIINTSHDASSGDDIPIYSKNVELSYTPPVAPPSPFPKTLRIHGLPLYQGSAVLLRSSLTALYTDCTVSLERMSVVPNGHRDRKVKIDLSMHGIARLTSTKAEWNVLSTYSFSPSSGLIYRHEIESIYPAPHSAVFDSVKESLLRLLGVKSRAPGIDSLESEKFPSSSSEPRLHGIDSCQRPSPKI